MDHTIYSLKKSFFLLSCLLISACHLTTNTPPVVSIKNTVNKQWPQDFKDKILCNCVLTGVADKQVTARILKIDKSFYSEINFVLDSDIKEILKPVIIKMKKDSIESLSVVGEGAAGKNVFDGCLKFYRSKQLDSIAQIEWKKWKKLNIDSLIPVKVPAY